MGGVNTLFEYSWIYRVSSMFASAKILDILFDMLLYVRLESVFYSLASTLDLPHLLSNPAMFWPPLQIRSLLESDVL